MLLQDCLIKEIYKNHDKDILLSALSNAFQCDVTLYQYRGNVILVDKSKPGRVESTEDIDLFYHNKHYKHVVPLVHTDEQYSSEVSHKDIHTNCYSIYRNKTFALVYTKNSSRNPQERLRLISMKTHLPILSEQIETLGI